MSERGGKMGDAGIHRDHEIEATDQRRGLDEIRQMRGQVDDAAALCQHVTIGGARILLQADEGRRRDRAAATARAAASTGYDRCRVADCRTRPDRREVRHERRGDPATHCTRCCGGAGRYGTSDGMLSSRVPNAGGRPDIGQCRSNAGRPLADLRTHCETPGSSDSSARADSSTARMTRAPRAARSGT